MLVVLRACPAPSINKIRPIEPKGELVRKCFASFKKAFEGVDYKLIVLLDKPNDEFRSIYQGEEIEELHFNGFNDGNIGTFHRQIDLALQSEDRFLFLEDDYFFLPEAGKVISQITLPFFTPYLHPDYFTNSNFRFPKDVIFDHHYWMSINSTTLTFGGSHQALVQEAETMKRYGWQDDPMWKEITTRQQLYTPIPTLATHMETPYLSLGVDWQF